MALNLEKDSYFDEFLNEVDFKNAKSVLDFGCGAGGLSIKISDKVDLILACDYSKIMLENLTKKAQILGISNIKTKQIALKIALIVCLNLI